MATTADALQTSGAQTTGAAPPAVVEEPKAQQPTPAEEPKPIVAEGQPSAGAVPQPESVEPQTETEVDLDTQPESSGEYSKYKHLFKDNPELRNIVGREAAFSELGNFSEVKGIVERIPTLEDAETMAAQAENLRNFGETFRSDPAGFFLTLRENDPSAASRLASALPQVLAETDPNLYSDQARFYTSNVLDRLSQIAQQSRDEELGKAINLVAQSLGHRVGMAQQPQATGTSEVERLRREIADRDRAQSQQASQSFWSQANDSYFEGITSEIEADIRKALPEANDSQIQRIGSEVWTLTNQRLQSQPQTMARINQYKQAALDGRITSSDFRSLVDYSLGRARLVKSGVLREVLKEWSEGILRTNKSDIEKKKSISAQSRDVGAGVQATNSVGQAGNGNKPVKKSVNTILENIAQGTYRR